MENIDFHTFFYCYLTKMVSTEVKLWLLSSVEHFYLEPYDSLSKVALFFEKMQEIFKNKIQRCCTPLMVL